MSAERPKRPAVRAREIVAEHDRQVERLGNHLDTADQIDRGPDDGEVEPVGCTDVAIDRRADMQRHDDVQRRLAQRSKLVAEFAHCRERLDSPLEGVARGFGGGARRFDREDRQQAIADEFQDLAAVVVDGLGLRVEQGVERAVKPRRSDDHSTALISSPVPRRIWPASTFGPVLAPR